MNREWKRGRVDRAGGDSDGNTRSRFSRLEGAEERIE
jgi:hypothetical protein